jgi:hypothetical protein
VGAVGGSRARRAGHLHRDGALRDAGRRVRALSYEAYPGMAERAMTAIGREIESRWPGTRVAIVHRVGTLVPGRAAVVIAGLRAAPGGSLRGLSPRHRAAQGRRARSGRRSGSRTARSGSASGPEAGVVTSLRRRACGAGGFAAGARLEPARPRGDAAAAARRRPERRERRRRPSAPWSTAPCSLAQLVVVLLEALGEHSLGVGHRGARARDVVLALAAGGAELGHPRAAADGQLTLVLPEAAVEAASSGLDLAQNAATSSLQGESVFTAMTGGRTRGGRSGQPVRVRGAGAGAAGAVVVRQSGAAGAGAGAAAGRSGCRAPSGGRAPGGGGGGVCARPARRRVRLRGTARVARSWVPSLPAVLGPYTVREGTWREHRTKVPWSPGATGRECPSRCVFPARWSMASLSPYDRGSEMLFGLIMALTITGALSVTSADAAGDAGALRQHAVLQRRLGARRRGDVRPELGARPRAQGCSSIARSARAPIPPSSGRCSRRCFRSRWPRA